MVSDIVKDTNMVEKGMKRIMVFLFHWFLIFGFLFEFPMFGPITSRRLCSLYAICILLIKSKATKRSFKLLKQRNMLCACFLMSFSFCICAINFIGVQRIETNQYFEVYYFFYEIIYILIWAVFCVIEFKDILYFSKIYISIMLLQSVVTYMAVFHEPFRLFIYENFYYGDDRFESTIQWGTRIMGINLYGSIGSIILFTGCALLMYLRLTRKLSMNKFAIGYMAILLASFFIGRTGFYLILAFLVLYFLLERDLIKKFVSFIVAGIGAIVVLQGILLQISPTIANIIFSWAMELFNSETRFNTFEAIALMDVPHFSSEMIFGTNVTLGRTPLGQRMGSDSGYARLYCALGIVGAICYYGAFLSTFLSARIKGSKVIKIFLYALIIVAFVIEYKEPYFLKYNYAFFVLTVLLFNAKEENKLME